MNSQHTQGPGKHESGRFRKSNFLSLKLSFVGAVRGLGQWPASRTKR